MSISSSISLQDVNTIFNNHAAHPKLHEAVYSKHIEASNSSLSVYKLNEKYEHSLRLFKSADSQSRQKRLHQELTYKLEKFDYFINLSEIFKDFAILTRHNETQNEHPIFKTIEEYISATMTYMTLPRYNELDTLKTTSLVCNDQYYRLVINGDVVEIAEASGKSKGQLFSPLCFLQLPCITIYTLMDERFKFDPDYNTVLVLLTTSSLAYYHDLKSMMKAPMAINAFIRYMTSVQGSGKSIELYTAACMLRRAEYPVIFINNWIDINTVTAFAPILILEMYGMFCSINCEDGKQYVKQFILEYGPVYDVSLVSPASTNKEKILLNRFVIHCMNLVYNTKNCRLCIIIDQINTPFGSKTADGSIFEFFRGLLTERLLVQIYVSSANNDTDRREEFFKHTSVKLMPKLSKLPPNELLLLAHASSISHTDHLKVSLDSDNKSFVFTEIDNDGYLSWKDRATYDLTHFNTGDIPYYLVRLCRSLGSTVADKSISFHKTLNTSNSIGYYLKLATEREPLLQNMLRIFLGLSGRQFTFNQPYDRRYIYEEELSDDTVIYRFVSQYVYNAFQSVYESYLEKSIFNLLGIPSPTILEKDLDASARGSIMELYLISILSTMRGLYLPSASRDGSFFVLPRLKLIRLIEFDLSRLHLPSGDYLIRPPSRHPIHDAYILIQERESLESFQRFINPFDHQQTDEHEQPQRNGVLFALQITISDSKIHYKRDHDISIHDNPRKCQVIADIATFVQDRNLYYAEMYISPDDPQDDHINWWPTSDLCPWFRR